VQPGQWLAVAAYSMHRNPAYWPARPRAIPCTLSSCRMQRAPQLRLLAGAAPAPRSMQGRGRAPPEPATAHAQCACAAARSLRWLAVDARGMHTIRPACRHACWPAPCCSALAQGNAECQSQGHELARAQNGCGTMMLTSCRRGRTGKARCVMRLRCCFLAASAFELVDRNATFPVLARKDQDACCKVLLRAAAEALLSPAGAGCVPAGALPGRHARSGSRPQARLHALRRRRAGVHRAQAGPCAAAASCMHVGKYHHCQHIHITTPADWCMGTLGMSGARALPGARWL